MPRPRPIPIPLLAVGVVLGGLGLWAVLAAVGSGSPPEPAGVGNPGAADGGTPSPRGAAEAPLAVSLEIATRAAILPPRELPPFLPLDGPGPARMRVLTPTGGPSLISFEAADGERLFRVRRGGDPRAAGAAAFELRGHVVDETGAALAGAEVWYGRGDPDGGHTVSTDGRGRFSVEVPFGIGLPVVVTAPGRTTRYRVLDLDGSAYDEPLFVLEPSRVLDLRLASDARSPEPARIHLAPGEPGDAGLQQFPFFLGVIGRGWSFDADGTARIEGLPAGSSVRVTVHHPQARVPPAERVVVGRARPVTVALRSLPVRAGRVMGAGGRPVAGALVASGPVGAKLPDTVSGQGLVPFETGMIGLAHTRTDGEGSFSIADGEVLLVAAPGFAGLQVMPSDAAPVELVLHPFRQGEPVLRLSVPACEGGYRIRCRPFHDDWMHMPCGEVYELSLPGPMVVDLVVRILRGGVVGEPRTIEGLPVQGSTNLDLSR